MRIGSIIFGRQFEPSSAKLLDRCPRCAWAAGELQTVQDMLVESEADSDRYEAALRRVRALAMNDAPPPAERLFRAIYDVADGVLFPAVRGTGLADTSPTDSQEADS